MSVIPITCDNCGAKYKLPPTFKGSQAKCQKCGSVIDVAKQRESAGSAASPAAAAKPATARPAAAAKPAVDRSKSRTGGSKSAAAAAGSKAGKPARAGGSRSRRGAKADDGEDTPRRGREKKPANNTPMILGGVGLLAVIVVVVLMMTGGDDKKKGDETAEGNNKPNATDANANKGDGTKPEEGTKPEATTPEGTKPEEGTTPEGTKPEEGAEPEAATEPVETPKPAPTPVDTGAPNVPKERWQKQKNPPQTMGEVGTALEMYGEVQWPASIDAAKKAEIMEIASDIDVNGGIRSIRAKAKLVKEGYGGLFGILEILSKLDYRQSGDGAFGFELNKAIEEITGGLNAGYAAVQADEQVHPAKALWNTKTVNAWMKTFAKWPDEATFTEKKIARAKARKD